MREGINKVDIQGIISEINIRKIERDTGNFIGGQVIVEVENEKGISLVPVEVFSKDVTKAGTPNKFYASIERLGEMKSISSSSREEATKIAFSGARLNENLFKPNDRDEVIRSTRVNGRFFDVAKVSEYKPKAKFQVEGFIIKMEPEIVNDAETDRLKIQVATVGYADKVEILDFTTENGQVSEYIRQHWNEKDTVSLMGYVKFTSQLVEAESKEATFGEVEPTTYTRTIKEFIVVSGSAEPKDEDEAYTENEIKTGLTERNKRKEEVLAKAREKALTKKAPATDDWTF